MAGSGNFLSLTLGSFPILMVTAPVINNRFLVIFYKSIFTVLYFIYFMACKDLYISIYFLHASSPLPYCLTACFLGEPNLKISSFMGSFTVRGQRGGGGFPKSDVIFTSQNWPG